jgi:hypothetical protein
VVVVVVVVVVVRRRQVRTKKETGVKRGVLKLLWWRRGVVV